jgi:hypothetical protein
MHVENKNLNRMSFGRTQIDRQLGCLMVHRKVEKMEGEKGRKNIWKERVKVNLTRFKQDNETHLAFFDNK